MAALYGRLQGNRGQVTRTGHDLITAKVETWQGIVEVGLRKDGAYSVQTSGKHGERARTVLEGNVDHDIALPLTHAGRDLQEFIFEQALSAHRDCLRAGAPNWVGRAHGRRNAYIDVLMALSGGDQEFWHERLEAVLQAEAEGVDVG